MYVLHVCVSVQFVESTFCSTVVCVTITVCRQRIEQEELDRVLEACDMVGHNNAQINVQHW